MNAKHGGATHLFPTSLSDNYLTFDLSSLQEERTQYIKIWEATYVSQEE